MRERGLFLALTLAGCASSPGPTPPTTTTTTTTIAEPEAEPPVTEPSPSTSDTAPAPTHELGLDEAVILRGRDTLVVEAVTIETIEASPEDPESYPAGSGVEVSVVLRSGKREQRASLTLLSEGYESRPVGWLDDYRVRLLEVHDPHRELRVDLVVERVGEPVEGGPATTLRVAKGAELELEDGVRLRFVSHGHKSVSAGQRSPLMLTVEWSVPGQELESQHLNLGPDAETMAWGWRGLWIRVTDYAYDQWMELEIGARSFERIEPESRSAS